ncbi:pentatricopeptide repeat-containing protein [Prunus yedoensis var. nudiflora]|uniref:Pentatricopeptide repeat-containing protein n=1 Tax=Prunus yedoensis var. nudiflora TaxID=2094558 RepID=A0A314YM26_PRUYE|nr:pentatricopeptide repeat-containing protein [Prunus yedoensis var. nudiflora]
MKSRWVFQFQNLNSHYLSSCASSLISPFKAKVHQNPSAETTSRLILNHVDISLLLSLCGKEGNFPLGSSLHASIIKNPEFFYPESQDDYLKLFDNMGMKDTVSWNTMISGFLRNREFDVGFGYFKQMSGSDFYRFDRATLTSILAALMGLRRRVFDEMFERNVITWTAVISGLAQNELYVESLELFLEMRSGVVDPNSLTYLASLTACSGLQTISVGRQIHGLAWKLGIQSDLCIESALMDMYSKCGSVEDAWRIFESTEELDEISMTVILVGFAQNGFESEAIQIFAKMMKAGIEIDPNMVSAVLEIGKYAADQLLLAAPETPAPYVLLANIYSSEGRWKERARTIKGMKEMGVAKETGISWIEIENEVQSFVVGDRMHPQAEIIYGVLAELYRLMTDEGYVPN